jgi:uncharacterized protein with FMN-binding domain
VVALSAAAIYAIYSAGYAHTRPAADELLQPDSRTNTSPINLQPRGPVATVGRYRVVDTGFNDGTYVGEGRGRLGSIEVTVTISDGRVTSARITWATTAYPVSRISALPAQVVERQSADIDLVSGATASARAFLDGARIALDLARKFEVVRIPESEQTVSGS